MKKILGLDYGEVRIGVAISDELGMLAHPVVTIDGRGAPLDDLATIVAREGIETIVIGIPRNMDGTYGPMAEKARAFADAVATKTGCTIRKWDERLTSVAAQRALHEAGKNVKQSRAVIDQAAAQIILQGYLDAQAMLG